MNSGPGARALMVVGLTLAVVLSACGSKKAGSVRATTGSTGSTIVATPASTATVLAVNNTRLGPIVADSAGETLYVFDGDKAGTIGCLGSCVTLWLPVTLELGQSSPTGSGVTAALGTVNRAEGPQVTLNGRPLYTYSKDGAPGDTAGDGVGGKWHVARPAGNPTTGGSHY